MGYDDEFLVAGEALLARPGFWSNHLLGTGGEGSSTALPVPEWFGDDGADADALSEVLLDPERWPVFRVPTEDGPGVVVVYRNMVGEYGIDYLLTRPGRSSVQRIGGGDGGLAGSGLTWDELVRIADTPARTAEGVQDTAARLLLILPLLAEPEVPAAAIGRLSADLMAVGAPPDTVSDTAEHLLIRLTKGSRHDPTWRSPLSGG
ncbi:hypothetical protein [Streptomyces flavochromogenes]|uniref:hypothetical protein n=1 Tax=Streptomyces flavochromogenes TaxID=68199 RepID=UPI001FD81FC2|nr:hypothetical protein [Streptomyces flavochromogenes]